MKGTVELRVLEQGSSNVLVSNTFKVSGHTTYLGYSKKLADAIKPYLEIDKLVDVEADITCDDGRSYRHEVTSFLNKDGKMVIKDEKPLPRTEKIFSYKTKPAFVWLECIDAEYSDHGHNKWYSLRANAMDETLIDANYGRHGEEPGSRWAKHAIDPFPYPVYMYFLKLYEKTVKGYEDHTDERIQLGKAGTPVTSPKADDDYGIKDADVLHLVKTLMDFANTTIKQNYSVKVEQVNEKAIESARKTLSKLSRVRTVTTFNKHLLSLMHVIPRKMTSVNSCMAKTKADFGQILSDENDLLDVLENQVKVFRKAADKTDAKKSLLDEFGLEIWPATPNQIGKVKNMLNDNLRGKIKNIYRVINKKTQKRFDDYLKSNDYPQVKEFWHGSRNANWWNILCQGLLLHSDAPTTGKMFGEGLYFAPSPSKSWGYTSAQGSYWANGNSNTAFMGIYATAHDNPEHVHSYSSDYHSLDAKKFASRYPGKDCLYCHGNTSMLRNDEVVLYREEQVTINFIVEFEV